MEYHTKDSKGNKVTEGNYVQVLSIEPSVIEKLNEKEQQDIKSMVGEKLKVEEVDENGSAWVTIWWNLKNGASESHSLGLSPSQMVIVNGE